MDALANDTGTTKLPELSCRPLRALLAYFQELHGRERLERVVAELGLGPGIDLAFLEQEDHWIGFEAGQKLIDRLTDVSNDASFPRRAGLRMASSDALGVGYHFLKAFGTPRLCYRKVLEISPVYNRAGSFTLMRLGRNRVTFSYTSQVREPNRRFCEFRMGQFESFPTIWGLPPARARELTCQVDGDACCTYDFEWVNRRFPYAALLAGVFGALIAALGGPELGLSSNVPVLAAVGGVVGTLLGALTSSFFLVRQRDVLLEEQNRGLLRTVESLQRGMQEIGRLNDTLEAKVEDRTRDLKVATERLEQTLARQVELDQLKTHFFTNINHDLRSPLTVVMGGLSSLLADPAFIPPARHRHFLELALRSAARLESMINDMLELTRIDAGMSKLELSRLDVRELARSLVLVTQPYGRSLKLELALDVPERPVMMDADADKLERVLMNLLFNACKFSRPGSRVTVGVQEGPEDSVQLYVKDEGIGISAEECARIFDRFYRAEGDHQGRIRGTGLGLAVVKEFVELHKGTVTVESEPGKGSTFFIRLPRGLRADAPPPRRTRAERGMSPVELLVPSVGPSGPLPQPPARSVSILLIEDDEEVRHYLAAELGKFHRLVEAGAGEDVLSLVKEHRPELVLTDVRLPGIDGMEVCRRLRQQAETADLPVLIFSSRADLETRLLAFDAGADDFVHKPFDPRELNARIEALLRRREPQARA